MLESLDRALARRRSGVVVLALIDLDGFREVNDTHGRCGGDALLKNIAERLHAEPAGRRAVRPLRRRRIRRHHERARTSAAAGVLAEALRASLQRPIFMEQNWQISAGIGIAQAPDDGNTADELSRRADLALRAAKREGRGMVRRFEPYIEMEYSEQRFIRRELESALASGWPRRPLSARGRRRRRRHDRGRGAVALDPSDARRHRAVGLHSARRAERPDAAARRIRVAPRADRRRALAEPDRGGESVADANPRPQACRSGRRRHCRKRHRAVARHSRSDRRRADRRSAGDAGAARSVARARREHRARRFRHRLFEPELPAEISRSARSRSTAPSSARSAPPAMPAPSSNRSSRSATRSA